ncbi:Arc family DNA-binding protein [Pararobbsia alpina]|nr:Arc family DNA-binding protein [Pararobbsia alpina]
MPVSMNQAIKHEAIDNRRSLNSELLHRLQRTLDEDKQPDDEKAD